MKAQAKKTEGGNNGNGDGNKTKLKRNNNHNDLPNGQGSKRRHPKRDSYCHSCVYDYPLKYYSNTFKCKKEWHKDDATIKNIIVGSERNFLHYTCKWRCGRIDKKYSSLNQLTYKPKYLNETLINIPSSSNNKRQHTTSKTTKQSASLALNQHETAYPNTAATDHFVPPNFQWNK